MNMEKAIIESVCFKEVSEKIYGYSHSRLNKKIRDFAEMHGISLEHFSKNGKPKKKEVDRICPVCNKVFTILEGAKKQRITCSHSCSNTHFRSGKDNGSWKDDDKANYRTVCWRYHKKECIVCGEDKIVAVHHYDENRNNNNPENLIPMCPTHHSYYHSKYKDLVVDNIEEFRIKVVEELK